MLAAAYFGGNTSGPIGPVRQAIFTMFKYHEDDTTGIITTSHYLFLYSKCLDRFSKDEVEAEYDKLEKEGLLCKFDDSICLTEKGKDEIYGKGNWKPMTVT